MWFFDERRGAHERCNIRRAITMESDWSHRLIVAKGLSAARKSYRATRFSPETILTAFPSADPFLLLMPPITPIKSTLMKRLRGVGKKIAADFDHARVDPLCFTNFEREGEGKEPPISANKTRSLNKELSTLKNLTRVRISILRARCSRSKLS